MNHILRSSLILLSAAAFTFVGCNSSELEDLKTEVGTLTEKVAAFEKTQIKALETQIASIEKEIAALEDKDKVQSDAVSALEGKVSVVNDDLAKLKESVSTLDSTKDEFSEKITVLDSQIASILDSLELLKARIAEALVSLSFIPEYSDGSASVQYTRQGLMLSGATTLHFAVQPEAAAEKIAKEWKSSVSAAAVYTLTKAEGGEAVELGVSDVSAADDVLTVKLDPSGLHKDFILGKAGASAAIEVSCGDIQVASSYIPLVPVMEEKPLIAFLLTNYDTDGDGQVDPAFDADGDGKIDGMDTATELDVSGYGFTSIDDILAEMPALKVLDCSNNNLTSIDLSNNTALIEFDGSSNNFTSIDFIKNESLTSVDLGDNADLKEIFWKSRNHLLKCRYSNLDVRICYELWNIGSTQKKNNITIVSSLATVIDGKTWKQFNVGASENNLYGTLQKIDDAKAACPTGWRLPAQEYNNKELTSLTAHYSEMTTYLGVKGRWFSGSKEYSESVPAVFFPVFSSGSPAGGCWSSTGTNGYYYYAIKFDSESADVSMIENTAENLVRCVKGN